MENNQKAVSINWNIFFIDQMKHKSNWKFVKSKPVYDLSTKSNIRKMKYGSLTIPCFCSKNRKHGLFSNG